MANPLPTGTTTLTNAAGASIELKYCGTCHLWRPPRSTHCRVCNRCVLLQDHHCAWTANCIGERNWPMFMAFLWSASLLGAWILAFGVAQLVVEARDRRWSAAAIIGFYPATMAALVMVAVFAPSVFCLATFTIYLSSHNRTTRENMRRRLGRRRGAPPPPHPYDLGSGWRNLLAALTRSPARYGAFVGQPIPRPGPIVV
ncbi:hypothetical protein CXG81DRAFT_15265 [Caulochytrium protostelioides]|uniref:Palmitoyltransferase n=1 Tax=Caulochytrium protostelioides TaxID=1555241 RepID=A0A4P9WZE2_9FUNG|nr:hypothetical protein CXG81DRAFT_15265 [Caulochytrium protostelioides]|eukprot:RKO98929.1 hypothetical protein CXG81DRAFT_15265 [Caulochytrium protostelioides]